MSKLYFENAIPLTDEQKETLNAIPDVTVDISFSALRKEGDSVTNNNFVKASVLAESIFKQMRD